MDKKSGLALVKEITNVVVTVLLAAIALLFCLLGLRFDSLQFIADYRVLLAWLVCIIIVASVVAYMVLYLMRKQAWYRLIFCAIICADVFALIFYIASATSLLAKLTSVEALQEYIDGFGSWAVAAFIVFSFLQVVVLPVPGSATVAAGVAMFGWLESAIYSFIGIVIGSIVAFAIGRVLGYKAVCWIVGKDDLDKWLNKIKGKDYLILSLMFLLPMFPDDVLCFVAGLSSMTWPYFLVMIVITRVISCFTVSLSFDLIPFTEWWGILTWIIIFALVVLAFWLVMKYSDAIDAFLKSKFKFGERSLSDDDAADSEDKNNNNTNNKD